MKKILLTLFLNLCFSNVFSQWVQTNGPGGGYTKEIVEAGGFLILNAGNGGVYRSGDNGDTWKWSSSGLPCNYGVTALVENNGILYAAIGTNGVYKSTTNGASWIPINKGIEGRTFYSLFVTDTNVYGGDSEGGVYFSPDNGESWQNKSTGISNFRVHSFLMFDSKVYAGGVTFSLNPAQVLFETTNNGDTWSNINVPNIGANGIRSMTSKNNILYVANDNTVYYTTDLILWNGTSVITNASIVSMGTTINSVYLTTSFGRYFYSEDDGLVWNAAQNFNANSFANHLLFLTNRIIMSTNEGLYLANNIGGAWTENNRGIGAIQIESLSCNNDYIFAGTDDQGIFRTSDGGQTWANISSGLDALNSHTVTDIIIVEDNLFLATGGGVYLSINNGDSWVRKFNPGINKAAQVLDYNNDVFVTAVNGSGVFLSQDMGETWHLTQTNGLNFDTSYDGIIIQGDTIVVSTADGEIFISENLGNTWRNISIPIGFFLANDLEFINNKLYAATTKGLYFSDSLGNNWQRIGVQLEIYDVVIDSDKIYAATSTGIYVTSQNDNNWYSLCDGFGLQFTNELLLKDDVVYAGTYNSGVWKRFKVVGDLPLEEDSFTIGNNAINLCLNSDPVNLFEEIGISDDTEGEWTPTLSSGTGVFNPLNDLEGTYKFTYQNDICGCENYSKVMVSFDGLGAGNSNNLNICNRSEPIDLLEKLGDNVDPNGIWFPSLASGTSFFDPLEDTAGNYTYSVDNNCGTSFSILNISLVDSIETPDYEINISDFPITNSVSISVNTTSEYKYSIDGTNFQYSNTFSNLSGGNYIFYGKEVNGCGEFQEEVFLLSYPRFFTPNGDGVNDVWIIKGIRENNYDLFIYDRFGKLLKVLQGRNNNGWNGVFNGSPLPAADYWFKVVFYDGLEKLGHFALKR